MVKRQVKLASQLFPNYAIRIVGVYLVLGVVWILFSDAVVEWMAGSEAVLSRIQTYKGVFYILITTFMLFLLIRRAEAVLTDSERQYRLLYESAGDGIFIMKGSTFINCNPAISKMFGFAREDLMGKTPWEVSPRVQPDGARSEEKARAMLKAAVAGVPQFFEWKHMRADGSLFDVEVNLNVMELPSGSCIQALVRDISERKRVEAKLQEYQDRLRSMGTQLTLAEERERRRIATCLHDGACQSLAMANLQLQALKATLEPKLQEATEEVSESLEQVVLDLRDLTIDLSPPTLYMFGLEPAVEQLLEEELERKQGIAYSFEAAKGYLPLTDDLRVLLYQSIRELIINIVKHGQATHVDVRIIHEGNDVQVSLRDNGAGFDVDQARASVSSTGGFGLFNIGERLRSIGGTMQIESVLGQGSTVILTAPISEDDSADSLNA